MTKRTAPLVAAILFSIATAPAAASAAAVQLFSVRRPAAIPALALARAENAITKQSYSLRKHWGTPIVGWTIAGGWPVTFQSSRSWASTNILGYHDTVDTRPALYVDITTPWSPDGWSVVLDHEIIEALVDPMQNRWLGGVLAEPCDPVVNLSYRSDGVVLQDFVYPNWFQSGSAGPWDALAKTTGPLDTHWGDEPH